MKVIVLTVIPLNPDQSKKPKLVDDCHPLPTGKSTGDIPINMSQEGAKASTGMFMSPSTKQQNTTK